MPVPSFFQRLTCDFALFALSRLQFLSGVNSETYDMAYGRLDIFSPDGSFKTYPLNMGTTTLGRGAKVTIKLENPTIAETHISLTVQDGQTTIRDDQSLGGTFVDGERIKAGYDQVLYGGEEILIGDLRLIYHLIDESPTRPITVPEETTQRIEVIAPGFTVDLISPEQGVAPGAHIAAQLNIHNTGDHIERYILEVSGVPRDWVRLDRSEVEIAPQTSEDVIINFKPTRRPESAPGRYQVVISTRRKGGTEAPLSCQFNLEILPFSGFGIALDDIHLQGDERFKLYLHNQGSSPLTLSLTARDLSNKLRFTLPTQPITLAPGQRTSIQGQVQPKNKPLWGQPQQYGFDLIARAQDASGFLTAVRGSLTVNATLPLWAPAAAALAVLFGLLMILIGAALVVTRPPDVPTVNMNLSANQLTQGETLTVRWESTNAEYLTLLANGSVLLDTINPEQDSLEVDTSTYSGAVLLTLRAVNSAASAEASQALEIIAPLAISYFDVEPQQLIRYVVQTLTINWSVSGAVNTQISGLETFAPAPVAASYGASGTVQVAGIPLEPLSITLGAQDTFGTTLEEVFQIDLIDPRCMPSSADALIYSAPRADAAVIGTISEGSPITVDAQDESGQWLRILLSDGARGWGVRNVFSCDARFDPGQLRKEIQLPPQSIETPTLPAPQTLTPMIVPTALTPLVPTATGRFGG